MYMILFVLDDPDQLEDLLQRWEQVGIRGATIIESTGINRLRRNYPAFRYILGAHPHEEGHLTLIAMVPDEQIVRDCLRATESLVGDLDQPNTGIFAAWPVSLVKGLPPSPTEG